MMTRRVLCLLVVALAMSGCNTVRQVLGYAQVNDPSVAIRPAETRWLLVKNPRYGDVPSEPEYVWVEEDKVPTTLTTLIRGKKAIIAAPEIVAHYGAPPGGGRISPRQGVPSQTTTEPTPPAPASRGPAAAAPATAAPPAGSKAPVPETPKRGYVVWVDTTRIVIDLTAADGLSPGSVVSLRRDRIPIVHPVTGEMLGDLDEEVATARVIELRDKFSVVEIQTQAPGSLVHVRDRVIPK